MFNPRIRTKTLALVCRSLATMLNSGVAVLKSFELAARRRGDARCRQAFTEIVGDLKKGQDVATAMRAQGPRFPDVMIDLVAVGEQTGNLPEILLRLSRHFENNLRLRRTFYSAITWPVVQFVAAVLVIAALILILGIINESRANRGEQIDILGLGLHGVDGALTWLALTFGSLLALYVAGAIVRRSLLGKKMFDGLLLRIPVVGKCVRSFALARFSWAFALTQQAGMRIDRSLQSSFAATANGAFLKAAPMVWSMVKGGSTLHDALEESRLFPYDYLAIVETAEESGAIPEALEELGPELEDQARRSMQMLTTVLAWLIWSLVAAFIIFLVFRIFLFYVGMLNESLKQV